MIDHYLPTQQTRARWLRMDTAAILKRFFFCQRALILNQAAWVSALDQFQVKTALPRLIWEDAVTANGLRDRIFELRYPSRFLEIGPDKPLIDVFDQGRNAPNGVAFLLGLAHGFKPALLQAYRSFADITDELADGPSQYLLSNAIRDLSNQITRLEQLAAEMLAAHPQEGPIAEAWVKQLQTALDAVGGVGFETPREQDAPLIIPGSSAFKFAEDAARDTRFHLGRFYWPDIIDPEYPYGSGISLQLRSAVSHLNEIWAVESGSAILYFFADALEWEFVFDAARWTYDESRHARMGYARLREWGYAWNELPLGSFIIESLRGQPPIYRLGMLAHFETKNIGKKNQRAREFEKYHDRVSQRDMEFDWADETIHAHYGAHWIGALHALAPDQNPDYDTLRATCDDLVSAVIQQATDAERADLRRVAEHMIEKAERLVSSTLPPA